MSKGKPQLENWSLLIIITIMGLTSGGISFDFLYLMAFMILPMAYTGFYVMMKSGMGEEI